MAQLNTEINLPDLGGLVRLSHHRWMVPLIAEIGRDGGDRVAALRVRLAISNPSLRRTIQAACDASLLMPNPGYGHPLRPEYLLTPWGEGLVHECRDVMKIARARHWTELTARKWSLPVLAAIASGCCHYCDIARALPTSTPRALSIALDDLTEAGCISRTLVDGHPPRPVYSVDRNGRRFSQAVIALATASEFHSSTSRLTAT